MFAGIYFLFLHLFLLRSTIANLDSSSNGELSGSEYLQTVIAQLHHDVQHQNLHLTALDRIESDVEDDPSLKDSTTTAPEIFKPTPVAHLRNLTNSEPKVDLNDRTKIASIQILSDSMQMQPPPLSSDELVALYRAALAKGATLNWEKALQGVQLSHMNEKENNQEPQGYYYYFYPIKKLKEPSTDSSRVQPAVQQPQIDIMASSSNNVPHVKPVEPLFMAMTGFISMAVMFAASVLFFPKFTRWNLDGDRGSKVKDELTSISNVVLDALHGQDCTERLTCEFGRVARVLRFSDRPIRVLEILASGGVRNQLRAVRRYAWRKANCSMIACNTRTDENISHHSPILINESGKIKTIFLKDKIDTNLNRRPIITRLSPSIKIISLAKEEKTPIKYDLSKITRTTKIHNSTSCSSIQDCKINNINTKSEYPHSR